jgi:hypothetical protein
VPNVVHIKVENPDEILNVGAYNAGAIIRLQTSATQVGGFADVSGAGSTPTIAVVTATRSYTGYDPNGIVSSWYQTRYENVGATRVSDWTPSFQVGDETAGLLCSLYDVQQELITGPIPVDANRDELILEKIAQVSAEIEGYCGRWLAPRPTNPASTMTLNFDVGMDTHGGDLYFAGGVYGRELVLRNDFRVCGIRTLTALNIAFVSQPETGGVYSAANIADVMLRPRPVADGPANRLVFTNANNVGSILYFYAGYNTVQATGSFGPASVPLDIQAVAIMAAVRRYAGKGSGAATVALGPDGGVMLLANFSPDMMKTLDRYRVPNVG